MERAGVDRRDIEAAIRARCDAGDHDGAATAAIRAYGPELFGFLAAVLRSEDHAREVLSFTCERLWRSLPRFGWQCSMRTWAYAVARNSSLRYQRDLGRRGRREVALSECPAVSALAERVRTETLSCLRTDHPDSLMRLRDALPPEDRELLVLRVDRELAWLDLARVFLEDEAASDEALAREAARLRKRFQIVRRRLLDAGRRRGLFGEHRS